VGIEKLELGKDVGGIAGCQDGRDEYIELKCRGHDAHEDVGLTT